MNKHILPIMLLILVLAALVWRLLYPVNHPDSYEIDGFNYVQQPDSITCGPTSGLMCLDRYNKLASLEDVKFHAKTQWFEHKGEPVGMTSPELLTRAMTQLGVPSSLEHGDVDYLKHCVSVRRPPIVLLRSSRTTWHYVVVIGFSKDLIVTADPSIGGRSEMSLKSFMGAWDFLTDMEGRPASATCSVCSGTGRWASVKLGPLAVCEVCGGSGLQPDYLGLMLKSADIYPRTLIVPKSRLSD